MNEQTIAASPIPEGAPAAAPQQALQAPTQIEAKLLPETPQETQQNTPQPGSPRWNTIYGKAKELDRLKPEFERLSQTVELLKNNMGTVSLTNIQSQIATVQEQYKQALESADHLKAAQLNTQLMGLTNQKATMENTFGQATYAPPQQAQSPIAEQTQSNIPIEVQVAVATFESQNPWYTNDVTLNAAFNAAHAETLRDPNWDGRSPAGQINETLRRFQSKFPSLFRQPTPQSAVSGVTPYAPLPVSQQQPAQRTLTPDERQQATFFTQRGATPEKAEAAFLAAIEHYRAQGVQL